MYALQITFQFATALWNLAHNDLVSNESIFNFKPVAGECCCLGQHVWTTMCKRFWSTEQPSVRLGQKLWVDTMPERKFHPSIPRETCKCRHLVPCRIWDDWAVGYSLSHQITKNKGWLPEMRSEVLNGVGNYTLSASQLLRITWRDCNQRYIFV